MIIPIAYKGVSMMADLKCDLYINDCIVVELKAIERVLPVHEAQLLTYMKLLKAPKGIIINFNCFNLFKHGQQTYVNEEYAKLPEE